MTSMYYANTMRILRGYFIKITWILREYFVNTSEFYAHTTRTLRRYYVNTTRLLSEYYADTKRILRENCNWQILRVYYAFTTWILRVHSVLLKKKLRNNGRRVGRVSSTNIFNVLRVKQVDGSPDGMWIPLPPNQESQVR